MVGSQVRFTLLLLSPLTQYRSLPDAINDGLNFFQACLDEKCIVVPGIFFVSDVWNVFVYDC
jgi:hypothetical protein